MAIFYLFGGSWCGLIIRDHMWLKNPRSPLVTSNSGALISTRLWCSMLSGNWWKTKYLIWQLHHNSEDIVYKKKVYVASSVYSPKAVKRIDATVNTQRRVASECWGNRSVSSIRITPWHLNPPAPSPNRPLDAVKNKSFSFVGRKPRFIHRPSMIIRCFSCGLGLWSSQTGVQDSACDQRGQ